MRILAILAFGLLTLKGVAADCECLERAARAANCDIDDPECFCESDDYIDALNTCASRSRNDCTEDELDDARSSFSRVCLSNLLEETTTARSSTRTTARTTSTPTPASTTSSRQSTTSTSTSSSSSSTRSPTNTAASSASNNSPKFTTAQIGGIAGGVAGFVLIMIAVVIFCTFRKYKKKDKEADVVRADDAEKFIEGGRQLRAASMTLNPNDRLYSTQRPLSYALGEYDSSKYDEDENAQQAYNNRGYVQDDGQSGYFNRFSGNYMEDSSQAFERRQSQGHQPPSSYRSSQRAASVPMQGPGGPTVPTASLSYEEYRNHAFEAAGEHTSLMTDDSSSGSTPHRSVSAPYTQRINRKPIGNSVSERTSYYAPQPQYHASTSNEAQTSLMEYDNRRFSMGDNRRH